jgi:hypothetical protein
MSKSAEDEAKAVRDMEAAAAARLKSPTMPMMNSLSIDRAVRSGGPVPFGRFVPRIKKWD